MTESYSQKPLDTDAFLNALLEALRPRIPDRELWRKELDRLIRDLGTTHVRSFRASLGPNKGYTAYLNLQNQTSPQHIAAQSVCHEPLM